MPSKGGFKLTEQDIEILTWVYQLRLATIDHVCFLTGRTRTRINRRLVGLTKHGYLYRRRSFPFQKYIYTLNRQAVPILVEQGIASKETMNLRVRLHELTELFLKHAMMLTDIHTTLELASRESDIKLHDWQEGNELHDSVIAYEAGERVKYPVRPDAYFMLQDTRRPEGKNRAYFFLEADRSTTTSKRFKRKITGYQHYYEQGLHTKKYGIEKFRVITITLTDARAEHLCEATKAVLPSREQQYYFFTSMKHFNFENPTQIHAPIFLTPQALKLKREHGRETFEDTGQRYTLIPPLASKK